MPRITVYQDGFLIADSGAPTYIQPPDPNNPFFAWKAQGKDLMWVQTWGLQRALSDAEWAQAIAAGYTKDGPVTPPVDFPNRAFPDNQGVNYPVTGNSALTIIVPEGWKGRVMFGSGPGSNPRVSDGTVLVNGQFPKPRPTASAVHTHKLRFNGPVAEGDEIPIPTGTVSYQIEQASESVSVLYYHAYPE